MKKEKKRKTLKLFIGILIGILIASPKAFAAIKIAAGDVGYSGSSSGSSQTTLKGAIDETVTKAYTAKTLTLGATNGTGVAVTKGYYNKVNTTAVYNAGVAAGATTHSGTYTYPANSTGGTVDMGTSHSYRYVDATNVYTKGKADGVTVHTATFNFASGSKGSTSDGNMGVTHSYRYVNASNVYAKGKADGATVHSSTYTVTYKDTSYASSWNAIDLGETHSYQKVNVANVYSSGQNAAYPAIKSADVYSSSAKAIVLKGKRGFVFCAACTVSAANSYTTVSRNHYSSAFYTYAVSTTSSDSKASILLSTVSEVNSVGRYYWVYEY